MIITRLNLRNAVRNWHDRGVERGLLLERGYRGCALMLNSKKKVFSEKECQLCGRVFITSKGTQIYCSTQCQKNHGVIVCTAKYKKKEIPKKCLTCGKDYITHQPNQKYCSTNCVNQAYKARYMENPTPNTLALFAFRFKVLHRDNFRCRYCGRGAKEGAVLVVDHIHPKAKGGENDMRNYAVACHECNSGKGDMLLDLHKEKELKEERV